MTPSRFVQVAVNVPGVSGVFDYLVPPELDGAVARGCLVVVPFGKQSVQGLVMEVIETPSVPEPRPVTALVDPQPAVTALQMRLAGWLSEACLAPLAACLGLMVPPGLLQHADTLYRLNPPGETPAGEMPSPLQKKIIGLLQRRGPLRGRQLEAALPHQDWKSAARALERRGGLAACPVLPPPTVHPRLVRTAQLACPPAELEGLAQNLGRGPAAARRQSMLNFLVQEPMPVDVTWVKAAGGGSLADLQALAEKGLVTLGESEVWRDPLEKIEAAPAEPPVLTPDQAAAWEHIRPALAAGAAAPVPILLHGVTGSGKTELYLLAVEETLRQGRQALVLVPEIALTPQTVRRFVSRFPGQVGLVHSGLSPGERYDTWRRARLGMISVIVGPRSALFSPLPNPGLVVVDECHDESYFQGEIAPTYSAVEAALACARLAGIPILLGSATPGVGLLQRARQEGWQQLSLPRRAPAFRTPDRPGAPQPEPGLPSVRLVDMREELKDGNRSIFSRALAAALESVLQKQQQAILFLNRRGDSTYVFCRDCGASLRCPRCDLPLTYHTSENALLCHTCGYHRLLPSQCPQCAGRRIARFGTGTEKVEAEVQALFPQARTLRWDAGTTRQKGAHDLLLAHFAAHRADVLVGTRMLAKGLDLPLVTLVGVVLADVGLNLPDYSASERTFQLLTQVIGRAGRSPLGGEAIVQTFMPEHFAIRAAASHDFEGFTRQELENRRRLGYPPFARLVRLEVRSPHSAEAETAARRLAGQVQAWVDSGDYRETEIIGPVPCFFAKRAGVHRWQVVLRGPDPARILRGRVPAGILVEVDPPDLL